LGEAVWSGQPPKENRMANVALATPHGSLVNPTFYRHLLTMQGAWPQHIFTHVEIDTMIVGKARNDLVTISRDNNLDVVWFVDNDTLIPPHAGVLIEQAMNLGVVSGVYYNRRPPYTPQLFDIATETENSGMYWPVLYYPESGMDKRDAVGAGCIAINIDVFKELDKYWTERFAYLAGLITEEDPDVAYIIRHLSPWFEVLNRKGEDMYFCERCRRIGQDIWVNYDVKCVHLSEIGIDESQFLALRNAGLIKKEDTLVGAGEINAVVEEVQQ